MTHEIRISEIHVGTRFRKAIGDIDGLVASIQDVDLLQPILVTPDNKLIAGERRIEAFKRLGKETISAVVVEVADD